MTSRPATPGTESPRSTPTMTWPAAGVLSGNGQRRRQQRRRLTPSRATRQADDGTALADILRRPQWPFQVFQARSHGPRDDVLMRFPHSRRADEGTGPASRPRFARLWMLATHRHDHQEIATVLSDLDGAGGRTTELYAEAVQQLGSDEAPLRFDGLCALEELGQGNPAHRQAIVNVICAYLRAPFPPTAPASNPGPKTAEGWTEPGLASETRIDGIAFSWHQERQVRLTAQRILAEHLRDDRARDQRSSNPPGSRFWDNIRLDLSGATLIDFDLVNGVTADANFHRAAFAGDASFDEAAFNGAAGFGGVVFGGDASFGGAAFTGAARFGGATFTGAARFGGATFTGAASFPEAAFGGDALFSGATFSRGAGFRRAEFGGAANFHRAAFGGVAGFRKTAFAGHAGFGEVAFIADAWFDKAVFSGDASFDEAEFSGDAGFGDASFAGDAWFDETIFSRGAWFAKAAFSGDAWFGKATFTGDAGFGEAAFTGDAWFGEAAFIGGAGFGEAAFAGDAWFDKAIFGRGASFDEAEFSGDAAFGEATFTGGAWFGEASFSGGADALYFERARILSPSASHVWPLGWRLADADGGGFTVVRANDDGSSTAPRRGRKRPASG
jgi:Pentapeptide repeats (9 copies)